MLTVPYQQEVSTVAIARVLIVDDDSNARKLLRRFFQHDFILTFAESGQAALRALAENSYDLVLLDVNMPGVSGFDVVRGIRSTQATADLPIILISALSDNATIVEGLQLGANDYITKPIDLEVVRARVNTQLAIKRATDARKETIAQLQFTQEMQENFTRIVSHDLKGPLTNIRMAQFMLRDMLRGNAEANYILDNMDVTLNSMVDMLRVFLDAMDSQQLEPEIAPLDVESVIAEVLEQYRLEAGRKHIRLTMDSCDGRVLADARLLRQILGNLVSNAVKFSPSYTHTHISAERRGVMIRFCVTDSGPGIPPEERGQLYGMFGKLSTRPTAGENSTGLGLWIVKQLTDLQGGRVGVDQPEAGGSSFWIELLAEAGA